MFPEYRFVDFNNEYRSPKGSDRPQHNITTMSRYRLGIQLGAVALLPI